MKAFSTSTISMNLRIWVIKKKEKFNVNTLKTKLASLILIEKKMINSKRKEKREFKSDLYYTETVNDFFFAN